jgi:Endosomal/lysosomal potassium channel TMEM175
MSKGRIEAFSDRVIAILITIMVLGLRAPLLYPCPRPPFAPRAGLGSGDGSGRRLERQNIGNDLSGRLSTGLCEFVVGLRLYVLVAVMWLIPDRRIERL